MKRFGSATWNGGLREGKGSVETESGALEIFPPTFFSRYPGQKPYRSPNPTTSTSTDLKSKRGAALANVGTLLTALPVHSIAEAKDFVRLHPDDRPSDDSYWSSELCFVTVPIKGQKRDTLHMIYEDLATQYLPSARIQRFRLALATLRSHNRRCTV
jgi:hypothetical protein